MRVVTLVLLCLSAVFAVNCGGSDDGGFFSGKQPGQEQETQPQNSGPSGGQPGQPQVQTGSTTGACALVTRQDAETALGAPVKPAESVTLPRQNMGAFSVEIAACDYRAASGTGQVSIQTWKAPQSGQVAMIAGAICTGAEKISGVGDSACWLDRTHTELQIFKGATFIGLTVQGRSGGGSDAAITALARKAADRAK